MKTRLIGLAALLAFGGLGLSGSLGQEPASPATQPAHSTDIPVKQVVLFSSGVGYFEHGGTVSGDAATELRFKTDQVNDILKSLLLQDMDGGTVGTVSYPGLAPLAHTLKSFQVDITANPDMADLLNQLRGAKITLSLLPDNHKMTGIIMGVENKTVPNGDKPPVETTKLNLKVERLFHSVNFDSIDAMELDDPKLQKELDDALGALVTSRDQDKKPMTLHFNGKGERHVRIGYLVETPIWKTSYRLVFGAPESKKKLDGNPATAPSTEPAEAPPTTLPTSGPATTNPTAVQHHPAKLQGWAIVENQTDNDWNDVQLSLVSGRPLSFIQDLYHSQYLPRPVVQGDNYVSLQPQTYAGGMYDIKDLTTKIPQFDDAPNFDLNSTSNNGGGRNSFANNGGGNGGGGGGLFGNSGGMGSRNGNSAATQPGEAPIDPTASIISSASAGRVGELFKYRMGNVTLPRQTSAMIPIVTDDIDAEKVSIYNASVLSEHPLLGARVKNNTGKFLLQGPVTVVDHGSYAGDARIEDLPPGQERLISFGIDQQVQVDSKETRHQTSLVTGRMEKGFMFLTSREVIEHTYVVDNKSDETRTIIIEHPRHPNFELTAPPKATETTADLLRFRHTLAPHKIAQLVVAMQHVSGVWTEIVSVEAKDLAGYLKDPAIPEKVRAALAKAVTLKDQVTALKNQSAGLRRQMDDLIADQTRIRDNLKSVSPDSDYSKRLMKKIDEEESAIEKLQAGMGDLYQKTQAADQQLHDYLTDLTVGM